MFERFTERARRVMVLAQEEARRLNHNFIGTEHLLLGLIDEGEGVAAQALADLGVTLEPVRAQIIGASVRHVEDALRSAVFADMVGGAYLFGGPRGSGKRAMASRLAEMLTGPGTPVDVFEVDAAANNGVKVIRSLILSVSKGSPDRWKVCIIDEAHMLTKAAMDGLASFLEERPVPLCVVVLLTTDPAKVDSAVRARTQPFEFPISGGSVGGSPPFTPRSKRALELSLREALQLGHAYIGTEHILLGIVSEGGGVAVDVLTYLRADPFRVRQRVIQILSGYGEVAPPPEPEVPALRVLRRILNETSSLSTALLGSLDAEERALLLRLLTDQQVGTVTNLVVTLDEARKLLG